MKLVLASNSPRRKEILTKFGYNFAIVKSDLVEEEKSNNAINLAKDNALNKAKDVFNKLNDKDTVVLGADTIVVYNGIVLGKPKDKLDAFNTLKLLSNKTHQVITGYAIITSKNVISNFTESSVKFNYLSDELINKYILTGSPLDKAGSYGIQDDFPLVKSYSGSLNNIIGLPIEDIKPILDELL